MAVAVSRRRGVAAPRAAEEVPPPAFSHTDEGERNPPPWPVFGTQRPTDGELHAAHYETKARLRDAWRALDEIAWEPTVEQAPPPSLAWFWWFLAGGCGFVFFAFMAQGVIR